MNIFSVLMGQDLVEDQEPRKNVFVLHSSWISASFPFSLVLRVQL